MNLQDKLRNQLDNLFNYQQEQKVSYILIKKLDISEDFLMNYKITESMK